MSSQGRKNKRRGSPQPIAESARDAAQGSNPASSWLCGLGQALDISELCSFIWKWRLVIPAERPPWSSVTIEALSHQRVWLEDTVQDRHPDPGYLGPPCALSKRRVDSVCSLGPRGLSVSFPRGLLTQELGGGLSLRVQVPSHPLRCCRAAVHTVGTAWMLGELTHPSVNKGCVTRHLRLTCQWVIFRRVSIGTQDSRQG